MSLPVFCNHYKLSPRELQEILRKNNIDPNLRLVKEVPAEWNEIVSKELNLPPLKPIGIKINPLPSTNGNESGVTEKIRSFEELEQVKVKESPTPSYKKSRSKKDNKKKNHFFVYVKYIAPDNSHAFVKKIDDLNAIGNIDLRSHDNSFKIQKGVEDLAANQVLLASEASRYVVDVQELYFQGLALHTINHFKIIGGKRDSLSVNSNLRFSNDLPDNGISTVKFTYNGRYLACQPVQNMMIENPIPHLQEQVKRIIPKKELNEEDKEIFKLYKTLSETFDLEEQLQTQFEVELEKPAKLDPDLQYDLFLTKWMFLKEEWVNIKSFRHLERLNLFFTSWLDSKLPISFWNEHLIDACIQYEQSVNPESKHDQLSYGLTLNIKHREEIGNAIVADQIKDLLIDTLAIYKIYEALINLAPLEDKERFNKKIQDSISPELKFELWLLDENAYLPKKEALVQFESQNYEIQERILKGLTIEEIVPLIPKIKKVESKELNKQLIQWAGERVQDSFSTVSFDIESNIKAILEIAWNQGEKWTYYKGEKDVTKGLPEFGKLTLNPEHLFVGHNIIDFDCPILEEQSIKFNNDQLWDTLLVEMLLRPTLKSFALLTGHKAEMDAKLTMGLFKNQVLRMLKMPVDKFEELNGIFPKPVREKLNKLREELPLQWVNSKDLESSDIYFRPQTHKNSLFTPLKKALKESQVLNKIIVGPNLSQRDFLEFPEMSFYNKVQEHEYTLLDFEKISNLGEEANWIKQALLRFIHQSIDNDQKPYWGILSTAIQIKVSAQLDNINNILTEPDSLDWDSGNLVYMTVDDLLDLKSKDIQLPQFDFFLVHPELISVTNKTCLRELDMEYIISLNQDNHFWMKFSGGQSFVGISKKEFKLLKVKAPAYFTNFWIEKYNYSKYKVWGNFNWEKILDEFPVNNKTTIIAESSSSEKGQKYFAKINISPQQNKEILRFNPESIYRSRYWVFQKELIDQAIEQGEASVLLIQQHKEIESLETYFRSLGYYIPDRNASLGRRLELLHQSNSRKKIIIDTPDKIDAITKANHSGNLTVVLDSFNLAEKFYIAKNSNYYNSLVKNHSLVSSEQILPENSEVAADEADGNISKIGLPLIKDTFFHLKLEKPLISYYSDLIFSNNPKNKFWILDPRISDYPDYGKSWGAKSRSLSLWKDYDVYEKDVEHADKHIPSPRPLEELPFSLEETKKILSSVFLGGHKWYSYQEPCLDDIIPAKEDVLVNLPTGGGKSLLFQAPALFRSTFTNKLTLVITPLKALMEDQVYNLWEQGFYGSVEYLNSDRNTDTPLIYRSLAGGEISLLYITPERFRSRAFLSALEVRMQADGGLEYAVFDEAHCLSQWGHEFRPDYFNAAKRVNQLRKQGLHKMPLLLFSATVSEKIYKDFQIIFHD